MAELSLRPLISKKMGEVKSAGKGGKWVSEAAMRPLLDMEVVGCPRKKKNPQGCKVCVCFGGFVDAQDRTQTEVIHPMGNGNVRISTHVQCKMADLDAVKAPDEDGEAK